MSKTPHSVQAGWTVHYKKCLIASEYELTIPHPAFLHFSFVFYNSFMVSRSNSLVCSLVPSPLHFLGQGKPSLTKFETQDLQKACSQLLQQTGSMMRCLHIMHVIYLRIMTRWCYASSKLGSILGFKPWLVPCWELILYLFSSISILRFRSSSEQIIFG